MREVADERGGIYGVWWEGAWLADTAGLPYYGPKPVMIALRHNCIVHWGLNANSTAYQVLRMPTEQDPDPLAVPVESRGLR